MRSMTPPTTSPPMSRWTSVTPHLPRTATTVSGWAVSRAKPDRISLKLCLGYHAGYKVVTYLSFAWPDAYEKARYAADILMKKMKRKGMQYEDLRIDYVGLNALHLDVAEVDDDLIKRMNEVVLRIAIRTKEKRDAQMIIPEISPLQLNGPPGASFFGGRVSRYRM